MFRIAIIDDGIIKNDIFPINTLEIRVFGMRPILIMHHYKYRCYYISVLKQNLIAC